jgi:hypothetical protein
MGGGSRGAGTVGASGRVDWALWSLLVCVLVVVGSGLLLAPAADASTSFTWSGGAAKGARGWSETTNWGSGVIPSLTEPFTLEFPRLTSPECTSEPVTRTCYKSENNLSDLNAESIKVDNGGEYVLSGDEITLGSGGMTVEPEGTTSGFASVSMPIALGASQTWHLSGASRSEIAHNLFYVGDELKGSGAALTFDVSNGLDLVIGADVQVGALSIDGAEAAGEKIENGVVELGGGGALNSADGEPVNLSHVFFSGSGQLGALHTSAATVAVGGGEAPAGKLEAASVTLDRETGLLFEIPGGSSTPGVDYSQLVSSGPVDLGSATLVITVPKIPEQACPVLTPGQQFTFVSTTGALGGEFGNAPEGSEIPIVFAKECDKASQTVQIEYHESGGTQTVTGTVEAKKGAVEGAEEIARQITKKTEEERAAVAAAAEKQHEEELAADAGKYHQEEEAIAAANKHQAEEYAASKKQEEEAAKDKLKPLTRAQKLAKALRSCKKGPKKKRASCEVKAKKQYGPPKPKAHGKRK